MGWEKRGGRSYYYTKLREGGRVCSKYAGSGILAQICAEKDKNERQDRAAKRDADRRTRKAEAQIDRQLADAESVLAAMTHATLYAAGYHKHKGEWRKKRHARK